MGLLEVASILAWLVVATIAVPRCEIPTPTGATACTTTDHWRDDVLCRLFGSTVTQTTGGGAGGGPAVTTTFQAYDGLLMNAYQRVTDSNKYRRKSGNKAVSNIFSIRENLLNARYNSSNENDKTNILINMERQISSLGRELMGDAGWRDTTCSLQTAGAAGAAGTPTGRSGQCGDRTDTTQRVGQCPGN